MCISKGTTSNSLKEKEMILANHERINKPFWPIGFIIYIDLSDYVDPVLSNKSDELYSVTGIIGEHKLAKMASIIKDRGLNDLPIGTYYSRAANKDRFMTGDEIFLSPITPHKGRRKRR